LNRRRRDDRDSSLFAHAAIGVVAAADDTFRALAACGVETLD